MQILKNLFSSSYIPLHSIPIAIYNINGLHGLSYLPAITCTSTKHTYPVHIHVVT